MKNNFTLTEDQNKALEEIKEWLTDKEADNFKTLSGFAGTGKTVLLDYVADFAKKNSHKIAVTATTNKAVKVLKDKVDGQNFMTIHSALGIKVRQQGTQEIFEPDSYNDSQLTDFDLVIIDECSMISSVDQNPAKPSLLSIILNQATDSDTKVLFCGDPAQLQPINEDISKCFSFSPVILTEIVRYDDGIAHSAKQLRMKKDFIKASKLYSDPDVVATDVNELHTLFKDWRENPDKVRLLTWRNVSVDKWNRILKQKDYGERQDQPWTVGDIVIANSPCFKKLDDGLDVIIMANSEEGEVVKVKETGHSFILTVKKFFDNSTVEVQVVKKEYKSRLEQSLRRIAQEARSDRSKWADYWDLKKSYHDIRHCYALTVHKSQGSTYDTVVIDANDIYLNRDLQNRNQLLYVGITRAAKKVYIL